MGNIQNATLSAIGSTERAIGVMKYFINQEVPEGLAKRKEIVDKAQDAADESTKYANSFKIDSKGQVRQSGKFSNLFAWGSAQHEANVAQAAAAKLDAELKGMKAMNEGSIFTRAKLANDIRKANRISAEASKDTAEKKAARLEKVAGLAKEGK